MKKVVSMFLAVAMLILPIISMADEPATIEVAVNYTDAQLEAFSALIDKFTETTGIKVELVTPGSDFETQLKTMMASNQLPDVWTTHGWSLNRYSGYLLPVNDQEWFSTIDTNALGGVMADENGIFYALGLSCVPQAVEYNADALAKAGVDPYSIVTWADFENACDKLKEAGITPVATGGSGTGRFNAICGEIMPTFWCIDGAKYDLGPALKDGTFDCKQYLPELLQFFINWNEKGYFNEDVLTLDNAGLQQMLGAGECAFILRSLSNVTSARNYYPEANLGFLPVPTSGDGKPVIEIGEGDAFGVWKDTQHADECWKLLAFLASPENATELIKATGNIPAVAGVELEGSYAYECYKDCQQAYGEDLQYDDIFDRKYLPSGMYAVMGETLSYVFDDANDIDTAVEHFEEAYLEKLEAAQ